MFIESGAAERAVAVTSSHFCSAERQYRFPLDYGSQRTPTAQWTVTGSGAVVLSNKGKGPYINQVCFGETEDYGITDANNMGAAMAPDDVKIRPYPTHEGMVFFYTQIQYLRGFRRVSFRSAYGNMCKVGGERLQHDAKISGLDAEPDPDDAFLSTSDLSFANGKVGEYIRSQFPDPSRWEVE